MLGSIDANTGSPDLGWDTDQFPMDVKNSTLVMKVRLLSPFHLLVWHAPLGVHSAKHRHQSPEWTILSHIKCFIRGEIIEFQVLLDSLHPRSTRASWWSPPVLQGEAVKIFLASVLSGIRMCLMDGGNALVLST